jgi:hypothetical protein
VDGIIWGRPPRQRTEIGRRFETMRMRGALVACADGTFWTAAASTMPLSISARGSTVVEALAANAE